MSRNQILFGTDQAPINSQRFAIAGLSFSLENGALRHIQLDGKEAIRNIAFVVRDRDWGTLDPVISAESIITSDTTIEITYHAQYSNAGAVLDVDIAIHAHADGLKMSASGVVRGVATGVVKGAFETNRAGFTVLHPIDGVAGCPVEVGHSDGSIETTEFPDLIEPWQPFMDITSLAHQVSGNLVRCQMDGDTFEMEDQRQWGDASFKTYNRPLAKPWPYHIDDGALLDQSVALSWHAATPHVARLDPTASTTPKFPQMALVITPEDARRLARNPADLNHVNPQRLLCHLDATLGDTAAQFAGFAAAQAACPDRSFDLELICVCDADPAPELMALAADMTTSGFAPASVLVCPSVDRGSTPPGSDWPPCPPLEMVHRAAARAFPDLLRGGGMVSFFPELNRKRPPVEMLDFISHGLCPIVHAADDISVMETLATIPHITRSARAIFGDRPYRIGPASIAMRQNPYGERTLPNPHKARVAMADDDPRHRAKFGAAYVIGLAAALAPADIAVWTPAAVYGPRGVISDGPQVWPIADALRQLSKLAGAPVHAAHHSDGVAQLRVGETELTVNLASQDSPTLGAFDWRATPAQS